MINGVSGACRGRSKFSVSEFLPSFMLHPIRAMLNAPHLSCSYVPSPDMQLGHAHAFIHLVTHTLSFTWSNATSWSFISLGHLYEAPRMHDVTQKQQLAGPSPQASPEDLAAIAALERSTLPDQAAKPALEWSISPNPVVSVYLFYVPLYRHVV